MSAPSSVTTSPSSGQPTSTTAPTAPQTLKICCACPETKSARDTCIVENGEAACAHLIDAHKRCLRALGFDI
jgi:cytochrome c oxidase assembly protein subunit 17